MARDINPLSPSVVLAPNMILNRSFSEEFVNLMKNRIVCSHAKYGDITTTKRDTRYPRNELKNAEYRIKKYKKTGNLEYLVDAANFLMLEFMEMKGDFLPVDGDPSDKIV